MHGQQNVKKLKICFQNMTSQLHANSAHSVSPQTILEGQFIKRRH